MSEGKGTAPRGKVKRFSYPCGITSYDRTTAIGDVVEEGERKKKKERWSEGKRN